MATLYASLSIQIRKLEAQIGHALFDRVGKRLCALCSKGSTLSVAFRTGVKAGHASNCPCFPCAASSSTRA